MARRHHAKLKHPAGMPKPRPRHAKRFRCDANAFSDSSFPRAQDQACVAGARLKL